MSLVAHSVEGLRVGVDRESADIASQLLYEHWLKRSEWKARSEALPLVVGVDPEHWEVYLREHGVVAKEWDLWSLFGDANRIGSDNELVPVSSVYAWFQGNDVDLPSGFTRLYDFIRQVTFRPDPSPVFADGNSQSKSTGSPQDAEMVLGAALSLVAKMPDRCRDAHGFIFGSVVSELIIETAAQWFPSGAPAMTMDQMTELIDTWLE